MHNARTESATHEWIPADLLGWLEVEAEGNGRTVEQEMLSRLAASREADDAKKKP